VEETETSDKLKRFDDVFRMLILVMTITVSIGFRTYTGLNLWGTLGYFIMSLSFWMLAHIVGSNSLYSDLEVSMKLNAWVLASLVTASTFAKFGLKTETLDLIMKIPIVAFALVFYLMLDCWLEELMSSRQRRKWFRVNTVLLGCYLAGYFSF